MKSIDIFLLEPTSSQVVRLLSRKLLLSPIISEERSPNFSLIETKIFWKIFDMKVTATGDGAGPQSFVVARSIDVSLNEIHPRQTAVQCTLMCFVDVDSHGAVLGQTGEATVTFHFFFLQRIIHELKVKIPLKIITIYRHEERQYDRSY